MRGARAYIYTERERQREGLCKGEIKSNMQRLKNLLVASRSLHKNGPFISHHYSRTISAQPNYYAQHHNYQEDQASLSSLSEIVYIFVYT